MRPYGYLTQTGYIGFIRGKWQLFATQQEYLDSFYEWMEEGTNSAQK